jgi:hypothetical protein
MSARKAVQARNANRARRARSLAADSDNVLKTLLALPASYRVHLTPGGLLQPGVLSAYTQKALRPLFERGHLKYVTSEPGVILGVRVTKDVDTLNGA